MVAGQCRGDQLISPWRLLETAAIGIMVPQAVTIIHRISLGDSRRLVPRPTFLPITTVRLLRKASVGIYGSRWC